MANRISVQVMEKRGRRGRKPGPSTVAGVVRGVREAAGDGGAALAAVEQRRIVPTTEYDCDGATRPISGVAVAGVYDGNGVVAGGVGAVTAAVDAGGAAAETQRPPGRPAARPPGNSSTTPN